MVACSFFFFKDTATTEIYTYGHTLSLHDALPISWTSANAASSGASASMPGIVGADAAGDRSHASSARVACALFGQGASNAPFDIACSPGSTGKLAKPG